MVRMLPKLKSFALLFGIFLLGSTAFAQMARLQVIHNAADPAAATVDVWLEVNGGTPSLLIDDFNFRDASAFIDAPALTPIKVGIAPGNSMGWMDTLTTFSYNLADGETYVLIANGVLNPANFEANPDNRSTAFNLLVATPAREASTDPMKTQFAVVHGATDAPTVDVRVKGAGLTLVDDAAYGDITGYAEVDPLSYQLEVTTSDQSAVVATYDVDLSSLGGGAAVVFASGFLSPGNDQNGEAFGLYAALANGTVVAFPVSVGIEDAFETGFGLLNVAPNPTSDLSRLSYRTSEASEISFEVYDYTGRVLRNSALGIQAAGSYTFDLDLQGLASGIYFVKMRAGDKVDNTKILLSK